MTKFLFASVKPISSDVIREKHPFPDDGQGNCSSPLREDPFSSECGYTQIEESDIDDQDHDREDEEIWYREREHTYQAHHILVTDPILDRGPLQVGQRSDLLKAIHRYSRLPVAKLVAMNVLPVGEVVLAGVIQKTFIQSVAEW